MKRKIVLILIVGLIGIQMSCSNDSDSEAESNEPAKKEETLVETINGIKYEWYPGKKQLKFKGGVDANGFRDGKWVKLQCTQVAESIFEVNGATMKKWGNGLLMIH